MTTGKVGDWDDSLLVDSWASAVEEYKRYHSIQARGENVEDVLKAAENRKDTTIERWLTILVSGEEAHKEETNGVKHDQRAKRELHTETADHVPREGLQDEVSHASEPNRVTAGAGATQSTVPELPQHLIGQVHDDDMKNLLMSWYYAGYYTGLYEGQQKQ